MTGVHNNNDNGYKWHSPIFIHDSWLFYLTPFWQSEGMPRTINVPQFPLVDQWRNKISTQSGQITNEGFLWTLLRCVLPGGLELEAPIVRGSLSLSTTPPSSYFTRKATFSCLLDDGLDWNVDVFQLKILGEDLACPDSLLNRFNALPSILREDTEDNVAALITMFWSTRTTLKLQLLIQIRLLFKSPTSSLLSDCTSFSSFWTIQKEIHTAKISNWAQWLDCSSYLLISLIH